MTVIKDTTKLPYDYTRCVIDVAECPHQGVCRRREPGNPNYAQSIGVLLQQYRDGPCENRIVTTKQWEMEQSPNE